MARCEWGSTESSFPVWVSSFEDPRAFFREVEGLSKANALGVGPLIIDFFGETRQTEESGSAATQCIIQEFAGVSLDRILEGVAAPRVSYEGRSLIVVDGCPGTALSPDRGVRKKQVSKILFDLAADLKSLHEHDCFFMDLKPSNVAVVAYGEGPCDIRATLIDFESMVTGRGSATQVATLEYYEAFKRIFGSEPFDNQMIDLGFLVMTCACALGKVKSVSLLEKSSIKDVLEIPGAGFFKLVGDTVSVSEISHANLDALAEECGLKQLPQNAMTGGAPCLSRRHGWLDPADIHRLEMDPSFVLAENKLKLAVGFHGEWMSHQPASRCDVFIDFAMQDPAKVAQGYRQAEDVQRILHSLGYEILSREAAGIRNPVEAFPEKIVMAIAQLEHTRWLELHAQLGFKYAERRQDGLREPGCNEYMLPWDELCQIPEESAGIASDTEASTADLKSTRARNCLVFAESIVSTLKNCDLFVLQIGDRKRRLAP